MREEWSGEGKNIQKSSNEKIITKDGYTAREELFNNLIYLSTTQFTNFATIKFKN